MKAEKGDLIRIVSNFEHGRYPIGEIMEVVDRLDDNHVEAVYPGGGWRVGDKYYVIHRKAGEEDEAEVICEKCSSFVGTEKQGSFCSRECIERYQKRISDLADEIREPFRKYREEQQASTQDAVNQPSHYTQGRFETIEIIEEITQGYDDGYVAYCVGNALKYLARAPFKHGEPTEDLAKAAKYLAFANEYLTQVAQTTE